MKKIFGFLVLCFVCLAGYCGTNNTSTKTSIDKNGNTTQTTTTSSIGVSEVQKSAPLQTKLDAIYASVKNYSAYDFMIGSKPFYLGKMIRNRCLVIFCALMILGLGIKILPVMYSPDKELDSMFWVKPVLLAGFLGLYPTVMGMVDKLMGYISFRDYQETQMAVTKQVTEVQHVYNAAGEMKEGEGYYSVSEEYTPYSQAEMNDHNALVDKKTYYLERINDLQTKQAIDKALDANDEAALAQYQDAMLVAQKRMENESLGVRIVHAIVVWLCDKISAIVRIFQTVLLCILYVGGPIAICLEIIPPLKGSLKKWFGIYVHTCMFTPVMYVIDCVTLKLYACQLDGGMGSFLAVIFQISMLVMYISVGKCVGYFVSAEGAGMGDLAKGVMKPAALGGAAVGMAAGAAKGKK